MCLILALTFYIVYHCWHALSTDQARHQNMLAAAAIFQRKLWHNIREDVNIPIQ